MKCQICDDPATVHVAETSEQQEARSCTRARSAPANGTSFPHSPAPQLDLKALLNLLHAAVPATAARRPKKPLASSGGFKCAVCGLTLAEFKASRAARLRTRLRRHCELRHSNR